jgi:hypothetical protein
VTRVHKVHRGLLEKKVSREFQVNKVKEVQEDCLVRQVNKDQGVYKDLQAIRVLKVLKVLKAKEVFKVLKALQEKEVHKEFRECKVREVNQGSKVQQEN